MENSWFYNFPNIKIMYVFKSHHITTAFEVQRKLVANDDLLHMKPRTHILSASVSEEKSTSAMATASPNINTEVYDPFSAFSGCCCYY